MKKVNLIYLLLILSIVKSFSQTVPLTADAGKDSNYCQTRSITLGGNPTAMGGVPPYKYKWVAIKESTNKVDSILKNSISSNPILYKLNTVYIIKLEVTDSENSVATASCIIGLSFFSTLTGSGIRISNPINDSVQLMPQTVGGVKPVSYMWSPEIGLSNPNSKYPIAKLANPAISYNVAITDSIGCTYIERNFIVTDIQNGDLTTGFVTFKNPVSNSGTMNVTTELLGSTLKIVSVKGDVQYQSKVETESIPLGMVLPVVGVYFYTVTTPLGKVISGSFVRE